MAWRLKQKKNCAKIQNIPKVTVLSKWGISPRSDTWNLSNWIISIRTSARIYQNHHNFGFGLFISHIFMHAGFLWWYAQAISEIKVRWFYKFFEISICLSVFKFHSILQELHLGENKQKMLKITHLGTQDAINSKNVFSKTLMVLPCGISLE